MDLKRSADLVLVLQTPKGRGVFASRHIPANTTIDICPVLVLDPIESREHIEKTSLYHYTYNWTTTDGTGKKSPTQAVVLGLGSMFNHSRIPNVIWKRDVQRGIVTYTTARGVQEGEELCISYGSQLWFEDTDAPAQDIPEDPDELLGKIQVD